MEILLLVAAGVIGIAIIGTLAVYTICFRKVQQGQALVKNGAGGTSVTFSGKLIYPVFHKAEYMDISVTRLEINRRGQQGLTRPKPMTRATPSTPPLFHHLPTRERGKA